MKKPILDEKATKARGEPVISLEEWRKTHVLSSPRVALTKKYKRCTLGEPDWEASRRFRTLPKYIQHLCTECRGEGKTKDPLIVGCKIYSCEVWPYRFGTSPSRKGKGGSRKPSKRPAGEDFVPECGTHGGVLEKDASEHGKPVSA